MRRKLGAGRFEIALHFQSESTLFGLIGGVVCGASGVVLAIALAAWRSWGRRGLALVQVR